MSNHDPKQTITESSLRPIAAGERIQAIDILRGVAILGVLVAFAVWNLGNPPFATYSKADIVINFVLAAFLDSKAYTLLAFLFGVGFSVQLVRANERGADITRPYLRRLFALLAIGLAHALLLRNGDILVPYASMGFVLFAFRKASNRALIVAAVIISFFQFAVYWLWSLTGIPFPVRPNTEGMGHIASNILWVKYWYASAITLWPAALPMFLFGLYVGRRRILENVSVHRKSLRRLAIVGFAVGILLFVGRLVLMAQTQHDPNPAALLNRILEYSWSVHGWALAAFYASTILLLLERPRWRRLLSPLAPAGRMALTNYLLQAAIIVPICIVFDLYDKVSPTMGFLMAAVIGLVQVPTSILWLKYFRFGPAEWLWRSLTYGKAQPMRVRVSNTMPVNVPAHAIE